MEEPFFDGVLSIHLDTVTLDETPPESGTDFTAEKGQLQLAVAMRLRSSVRFGDRGLRVGARKALERHNSQQFLSTFCECEFNHMSRDSHGDPSPERPLHSRGSRWKWRWYQAG